MTEPTAYPLTWPAGWPRTPRINRENGKFATTRESARPAEGTLRISKPITVASARERLSDELAKMGARNPILSTNLELTLTGLPRAGAANPSDPGVAVYFQWQNKPIVLACDNYATVAANIAAIAAHIGAMRGMARWKVGRTEQMFTGYMALPSATPAPRPWWQVLGFCDSPVSLDQAEDQYRALIRLAHPDAGGTHERAAELNAAIAEARKVLK